MDLQLKIQDKFAELIEEGYVDKIVKDALQGTVKNIIEQSLRNYSDFSKQLEKHISEGMAVNLNKLSLDHYNDIVLKLVQEEVSSTIVESAGTRIRERIRGILGSLEKKEWKLSEIIEKFRQEQFHYGSPEGEIGLHVEESRFGGWYIYFDKEAEEDKSTLYSSSKVKKQHYKFDYKLYLDKEGRVYSYGIENVHPDFTKAPSTGFDAFFFQLFANQAVIEVDEDDCELSYDEQD